jgi:hypothetical protein
MVNYDKAMSSRRKKVSVAGKAQARVFEVPTLSPCKWWSFGRSGA